MTVNGTASGAAGEATGTIAADQMAKVVCTNTKTTAPPTVPDKTGSFKVKKATVNGTDGDSFTFSAALQKLKADTDYTVNVAGTPESVHSNASGMAYLSFALKNGRLQSSKIFRSVPPIRYRRRHQNIRPPMRSKQRTVLSCIQ